MNMSTEFQKKVIREFLARCDRAYDCLYVYGSKAAVGALVSAVVEKTDSSLRVIYTDGATFCREAVDRCARGELQTLQGDYQGDLLILEDIQMLAGKESMQELIYGILDWYLENGKQILVTGHAPLYAIANLEPRVCAQLSGGISISAE